MEESNRKLSLGKNRQQSDPKRMTEENSISPPGHDLDPIILRNNSGEELGKEEVELKGRLRPRKIMNYKEQFKIDEENGSDENSVSRYPGKKNKKRKKMEEKKVIVAEEESVLGTYVMPNNLSQIAKIINRCNYEIARLQKDFYETEANENEGNGEKCCYDENCIPICADVTNFDFDALIKQQKLLTGCLFDIIMVDPPWQLSSSNPTRGVAIAYDTLADPQILSIPIPTLQTNGFIFIWAINAKVRMAFEMMTTWGYKFVDEIVWVKQTVNGKIAKGHGFYLQHSKETCFIGVKGNPWKRAKKEVLYDTLFTWRRGQSQKPQQIYSMAETLVPNGYYLEIFGRRNNLRNGWVTIGNEIQLFIECIIQ